MSDRPKAFSAAIFIGLILPAAVLAQSPESTLMLPSEVTVRDIGWSQITNTEEMREFFLAVVETLVFVAAFAFHPRAAALRQDDQGWQMQASMFLFGLIGMFIGFLVVHHGFLIGFVIFGLGSLFRFRMASSSLIDGAILIIVTLVGLAVGLNLPVMALVATLTGFVTLWFVTARRTSLVELKFKDEETLRNAFAPAREAFERRGFKIVSIRKTGFKSVVEFALSHKNSDVVTAVTDVLDDLSQAGHATKDWHVS